MISVIVPVYGVEPYIRKCVDSIRGQTYRDLEIILVDDGSPDNCPAICDDYAKEDSRIRVVHQKNAGLSAARNAGLEIARGDYIAFVDADDYIKPDMYEKLYKALVREHADMAICGVQIVDEEGISDYDKTDQPIQGGCLSGREILAEKFFTPNYWHFVVAWNKLYCRRIFADIRYSAGKLYEDEFIIPQILLLCQKVALVADPLYMYVQRGASIKYRKFTEKTLDSAEAFLSQIPFFIEAGAKENDIFAKLRVIDRLLYKGFRYKYKARWKTLQTKRRAVIKQLWHTQEKRLTRRQKYCLLVQYICPTLLWTKRRIQRLVRRIIRGERV